MTPGTRTSFVGFGRSSILRFASQSKCRSQIQAISEAWDGLVRSAAWRYGVEAETHPTDGQALARRLQLKLRDGGVHGVILVLPATRHVRHFLAAAGDLLVPSFPVPGPRALALLRAGVDPAGNAIVIV